MVKRIEVDEYLSKIFDLDPQPITRQDIHKHHRGKYGECSIRGLFWKDKENGFWLIPKNKHILGIVEESHLERKNYRRIKDVDYINEFFDDGNLIFWQDMLENKQSVYRGLLKTGLLYSILSRSDFDVDGNLKEKLHENSNLIKNRNEKTVKPKQVENKIKYIEKLQEMVRKKTGHPTVSSRD